MSRPVGRLTQARFGLWGQRYIGRASAAPISRDLGNITQIRYGLWGKRYGSFAGRGIQPTPVVASFVLNVSNSSIIKKNSQLDIAHAQKIEKSFIIDLAHQLSITDENIVNVDFNGVSGSHPVSKITQSRYGLWGQRYTSFSGRGEVGGTSSILSTFTTSIEWTTLVKPQSIIDIEQLRKFGGIFTFDISNKSILTPTSIVDLDFITRFTRDNGLSLTYLNSLNTSRTLGIAYLLSVIFNNITSIVASGTIGTEFSREFVLDIDYLQDFVNTRTINIATILNLLTSYDINLEIIGRLSNDHTLPGSYLLDVTNGFSIPAASLLKVASDFSTVIDFIAEFPGISIINLEHIGMLSSSGELLLEQLLSISNTLSTEVVFEQGVKSSQVLDIDYDGVLLIVTPTEIWVLSGEDTTWTLSK